MSVLVTLCFALSAMGLVGNQTEDQVLKLVKAFALGMLVWSCLVAFLGAVLCLDRTVFAWLLVAGLLGSFPRRQRIIQPLRQVPGRLGRPAMLCWLAIAVCSLAPNTHFDVQVYHYAFPEVYLRQHSLAWSGVNVHEGLIGPVQLLYIPLLSLGGEAAANLLSPLYLLGLLLVAHHLCESIRPGSGRLAVWLLLTSPLLLFQSLGGLTDLPGAFYACLALATLLDGPCCNRRILEGGFWLGAAVATKWSNALAVPILLGLVAWRLPAQRKHASLLLVLGLGLAIPQLSRNWLQTGDPLYPLVSTWHMGSARGIELSGARRPGGQAAESIHRFPFRLVPTTTWTDRSWQDTVNPLIWLVPLLGHRRLYQRSAVHTLAACCGAAFLALCLAGPTDLRYCLAYLGWFACLSACAWEGPAWLFRAAALPGTVLLGALLWRIPWWASAPSRQRYLAERSSYAAYQYLQKQAHPWEFVYLIGRRGYRCPLDYVCGDSLPDRPLPKIDYYVADLREPLLIPLLFNELARRHAGQTVALRQLQVGPLATLSLQQLSKELQKFGCHPSHSQVTFANPPSRRPRLRLQQVLEARPVFCQDGVVVLEPHPSSW